MEPIKFVTQPAKRRRIGVLTSGGDAPGMNGAVRAVVRMAIHCDCEAYAIFEGYEGLVNGGNMIRQLHWEDVRGWLSRGGTLIGSARSLAFRERVGRMKAAKNMVLKGIDALVVCGGDGSLTGADVFRAEWPGLLADLIASGELSPEQVAPYKVLNIVGLVGSIDNDMSGTDATIGCYSSLTRICDAVDDVFDTAFSQPSLGGISGRNIQSAPVLMADINASQPQCLPITSMTKPLWCEKAVSKTSSTASQIRVRDE